MNDDVHREVGPDERKAALSLLTTEHTALQSARLSAAIECNGRLAGFLAAVSAVVIALAFIGQTSQFGTSFYVFALTLLPMLAVLGVFTFLRMLQIRIEDSYFALAINRIRHYYVEAAPHVRRYLLLPHHDSVDALLGMGVHSSRLTPMLLVSGSVAFVNSTLVGTAMGLAVHAAFALSTDLCAGIGAVCVVLSLAVHHFYQRQRWRVTHASYKPEFPT